MNQGDLTLTPFRQCGRRNSDGSDEQRRGQMVDQALRDAAEQHALRPTLAVRADHHNVRLP